MKCLLKDILNENCVNGLVSDNYIVFWYYYFTIIFYYSGNESFASNMKDLQIEDKSIPVDSEPTTGKTHQTHFYEKNRKINSTFIK